MEKKQKEIYNEKINGNGNGDDGDDDHYHHTITKRKSIQRLVKRRKYITTSGQFSHFLHENIPNLQIFPGMK